MEVREEMLADRVLPRKCPACQALA
jgi:hypothetical protein